MSMMMPPDPNAAPGLAIPPGGGPDVPPRDVAPPGPMPGGGGMDALAAVLGGGGGDQGPPPPGSLEGDGGPGATNSPIDNMNTIDLIQEAMKLLMLAFAKAQDESHGAGLLKGMGPLQGVLAGDQKRNQQLQQLGGPGGPGGPGGGPPGP